MMRMQVRIHTKVWIWKQNRSRRFAYNFVRGVFLGANNGVRNRHGNLCENRCGNWCENWRGNWCENCGGKKRAHFLREGWHREKKGAPKKKGGLFSFSAVFTPVSALVFTPVSALVFTPVSVAIFNTVFRTQKRKRAKLLGGAAQASLQHKFFNDEKKRLGCKIARFVFHITLPRGLDG